MARSFASQSRKTDISNNPGCGSRDDAGGVEDGSRCVAAFQATTGTAQAERSTPEASQKGEGVAAVFDAVRAATKNQVVVPRS